MQFPLSSLFYFTYVVFTFKTRQHQSFSDSNVFFLNVLLKNIIHMIFGCFSWRRKNNNFYLIFSSINVRFDFTKKISSASWNKNDIFKKIDLQFDEHFFWLWKYKSLYLLIVETKLLQGLVSNLTKTSSDFWNLTGAI